MLKNISKLGSILNKNEQKQVTGGCAFGHKCEPWDEVGYTTCFHEAWGYTTHQTCDPNICYGGSVSSTTC